MIRTLLQILAVLGLLLAAASAVSADHRAPDPWSELQATAHELERAAKDVHRSAERAAHHGNWAEERALVALHELEERADHFHRQVERSRQHPYHVVGDYRALEAAYVQARRTLPYLHAYRHVYGDFARVERLMVRLDWQFQPFLRAAAPYYEHHGRSYDTRPRSYFRWDWWR